MTNVIDVLRLAGTYCGIRDTAGFAARLAAPCSLRTRRGRMADTCMLSGPGSHSKLGTRNQTKPKEPKGNQTKPNETRIGLVRVPALACAEAPPECSHHPHAQYKSTMTNVIDVLRLGIPTNPNETKPNQTKPNKTKGSD